MGANLMYSPLESVFEETMKREGQILTTYSSGAEFRAFFRIRNDNENQRETVVIYYDVTAPVHSGTLVMIENEVYLALNKETVENDVYYKSALIKCNGVYNSNDGMVCNIPFYSDNMKASVSIENNAVSLLNGNIEILTEENSLSKQIKINAAFNEFDRTFKVTNKYTIDGITHFICEVDSDREPVFVYSVHIEGGPDVEVKPDTTLKLDAIPYVNGQITNGATYNWTSSDNAIAIVDGTGQVTCLSEGIATISVTWIEKDVSDSVQIAVVNTEVPVTPAYIYHISGRAELKCGISRTYTLYITDNLGNDVDFQDFTWNVISDFTVDQNANGNKIELYVDDEDAIDHTFLLQVMVSGEVKTEVTIRVVGIV